LCIGGIKRFKYFRINAIHSPYWSRAPIRAVLCSQKGFGIREGSAPRRALGLERVLLPEGLWD